MSHDPLIRAAEERVGRVLSGKWRLDRLLGLGGMAAVYEATHKNGKRVAIKMLHASFASVAEARERFLREAYAANAVRHGGVVSVLDDGESEDGELFLLMELLEGETLEARSTRSGHRLALEDVLATAEGLLDVLAAAHAAGVVHRDIKPENVFVTQSGEIKVLDFGIAHVLSASASDRRTQTGSTMGTPAFMAPEQARGRWDEVDARSDVWAVGAVMFSLLSGRCVHGGETANETLLAAMTKHAPALAELCPDVPCSVADVVDRALAFDRLDRWSDASQMLAALRNADSGQAGASLAPSTDTVRLPLSRVPSPAVLAATAGALAIAAFAIVTLVVPARSHGARASGTGPLAPYGSVGTTPAVRVAVSATALTAIAPYVDVSYPPPLAPDGPAASSSATAVLSVAIAPTAPRPHPPSARRPPPTPPSPLSYADPLAARR